MHWWLISRYAFNFKKLFDLYSIFSLLGISLGVGFLVLALAGFSGFESTLKQTIVDVTGDIIIYRKGGRIFEWQPVQEKIKATSSDIKGILPFITLESLFAHNGKIQAVLLQGVDWSQVGEVLNLDRRKQTQAKDGELDFQDAFIGHELAKSSGLQPGEEFRVIVPTPSKTNSAEFSPKMQKFSLRASIDFGKAEYNKRFVITDLKVVQKLAKSGDKILGFRLRLDTPDKAKAIKAKLEKVLGGEYVVRDWSMLNRNLFAAVEYEKLTLFFVLLIMVVVACFNVATTLFVSVQRKYPDISVLKTLGARPIDILMIFSFQGLFLGLVGSLFGLILGLTLCFGLNELQRYVPLLPEDVYKLSHIVPEVRYNDLALIFVTTFVICFLSTILPALRGATLSPVKGLRYE